MGRKATPVFLTIMVVREGPASVGPFPLSEELPQVLGRRFVMALEGHIGGDEHPPLVGRLGRVAPSARRSQRRHGSCTGPSLFRILRAEDRAHCGICWRFGVGADLLSWLCAAGVKPLSPHRDKRHPLDPSNSGTSAAHDNIDDDDDKEKAVGHPAPLTDAERNPKPGLKWP